MVRVGDRIQLCNLDWNVMLQYNISNGGIYEVVEVVCDCPRIMLNGFLATVQSPYYYILEEKIDVESLLALI